MIRSLLMIAVAGFVLCIASISAALAIGGDDLLTRSAWTWGNQGANWDWDHDEDRDRRDYASGPEVTRELAWTGEERVEFDVRADVTYTQAPGPAKLVVTGPQGLVDRVEIEDGRVHFRGRTSYSRLRIVMTAPNVTSFALNGNDRLTIEGYRQDRLVLDMSGNAEVTARGQARELDVDISGSGEAELGQLSAEDAEVEISGSGEAVIAPTKSARLNVSGSGEITLMTRPERLESDVSGSGSIRQGSASASPSSPSPSPSPSPKKTI
ncbi:GIN domain-containing protein [Phenylobacterium sp.]|jgi:hypothetical protein|uniref:GIN domain-containing protein n=1 Tax=Phenylobacterium sp. TaxID=1871053 RepID=UPI002F92E57F